MNTTAEAPADTTAAAAPTPDAKPTTVRKPGWSNKDVAKLVTSFTSGGLQGAVDALPQFPAAEIEQKLLRLGFTPTLSETQNAAIEALVAQSKSQPHAKLYMRSLAKALRAASQGS